MDIKDVGASLDSASRSDRTQPSRSGSPASSKAEKAHSEVFFENSGRLGQVRALIDALVQVPEVRNDAVESAKSLLAQGALDTPEAAAKAAEGYVEQSEGLAE